MIQFILCLLKNVLKWEWYIYGKFINCSELVDTTFFFFFTKIHVFCNLWGKKQNVIMFLSKPKTPVCILSGLSKGKKGRFCHLVYWLFHYSLQTEDNKQFFITLIHVLRQSVPCLAYRTSRFKPLSSFKGNEK